MKIELITHTNDIASHYVVNDSHTMCWSMYDLPDGEAMEVWWTSKVPFTLWSDLIYPDTTMEWSDTIQFGKMPSTKGVSESYKRMLIERL